MNIEEMRQHFPTMPADMRLMVEQEVQRQIGTVSPARRGRKHMTRKVLTAAFAAAMLLGTTVAARVVYKMHTEEVGDYAVRTKIESASHTDHTTSPDSVTQDSTIQDITMEATYLPAGMVETEDGKYSYVNNLYKGGVSIIFYKMDTGDAQFEMLTTDVKETEPVRVNDHDGVYIVLHGGEGDEISYNQRIYVAYTDVHYVMEMFVSSDVSKEEIIKIAEGIRLEPVLDEGAQDIVHAYNWSDYLKTTYENEAVVEWNTDSFVSKSAMANTHTIGEAFAAAQFELPEEDWMGLGSVEIKVTDVQACDEVSLLDQSVMDHDSRQEIQKELDASGKLLPVTINYMKYGDGINSLNQVVDSRIVPQKLVYATVEYTNIGTEMLEEVLFFGNLIKIVEENGQMKCYKGKASNDSVVWDEAVVQGAAHYAEMWYYDVHGGERHNNYITNLGAGETATVHMAWLVPEEELPYLYLDLNTSGSGFEFCEESLAVGYVDIRQ